MVFAPLDTAVTRPVAFHDAAAGVGRQLLLTLALLAAAVLVSWLLRRGLRVALRDRAPMGVQFWAQQGVHLLALAAVVVGLALVWFDDPGRFATMAGLVTAGVAVALQRVITSFAAYLIILKGNAFDVGDRITIGGVRGDVVALSFTQTVVMEMGQAPGELSDSPSIWVHGRQYTGRIVRITNDKIFDSPIYNYTREFPYLWEELRVGVAYGADHARAEAILLDVARRLTMPIAERAKPALVELSRRVFLRELPSVEPRVFWRLTDNWVELGLRFVAEPTSVRALKDEMSRQILAAFDASGLGIASATFEIVKLPPLELRGRVESATPRA
jgi:small-conductance mechanosensitive channel